MILSFNFVLLGLKEVKVSWYSHPSVALKGNKTLLQSLFSISQELLA